jgi:hypothetical protein
MFAWGCGEKISVWSIKLLLTIGTNNWARNICWIETAGVIGNNECYQTLWWQKMTHKNLHFEPQNRQTERANFRYHLQAGEIIYSISYLHHLQNKCFNLHFNEAEISYFKYPFGLHFNVIFIFNSRCIDRHCTLIAHQISKWKMASLAPPLVGSKHVLQNLWSIPDSHKSILPLRNRYTVSTLWPWLV